ncbi:MAG: hypothetical protein FJ121_04930 [Deltaproteobacteria bacterium]|nr:hypothetical protein [Deltaproteobacteria bacterium]
MKAFDPSHASVRVRFADAGGQVMQAFLQLQDVGSFRFVKDDRGGHPVLVDFRVYLVNLYFQFIDRVLPDHHSGAAT